MRRIACALVLLGLAGCGGDEKPAREAAAPKPSITPFPTVDMAKLDAGVQYTTREFQPALRIALPEGDWTAFSADKPDHLELELDADPPVQMAGIGFHHMRKVFPPAEGGEIPGDAVDGPGDFAAWLTGHPHLRATRPKPAEALGLKGVSVDVTVRSSQPRRYRDCGKVEGDCVVMWVGGIEPVVYGSQTRGRFLILQQPEGGQLVIEQWAEPRAAFKRVETVFERVLAGASLAG